VNGIAEDPIAAGIASNAAASSPFIIWSLPAFPMHQTWRGSPSFAFQKSEEAWKRPGETR
jgi:hypothetical protein